MCTVLVLQTQKTVNNLLQLAVSRTSSVNYVLLGGEGNMLLSIWQQNKKIKKHKSPGENQYHLLSSLPTLKGQ
jgi:hypothetical protein